MGHAVRTYGRLAYPSPHSRPDYAAGSHDAYCRTGHSKLCNCAHLCANQCCQKQVGDDTQGCSSAVWLGYGRRPELPVSARVTVAESQS
eukprot:10404159-Alexandrium_andersonii.AAC.1